MLESETKREYGESEKEQHGLEQLLVTLRIGQRRSIKVVKGRVSSHSV